MKSIIQRECYIIYRHRGEWLQPLLFFMLIIMLFPLGLTLNSALLQHIAAGLVWLAVLFSSVLCLDRLFQRDFANGCIEQWLFSRTPLPLIALGKIIAHWLFTSLPLIILSPILVGLLSLSWHTLGIIVATLLLGTPTLSLVGSIISALMLNVRHSGMLLPLLSLPIYVPVLIFATSAIEKAQLGLPVQGELLLLLAMFLLALTLAPIATAAALRVSVNFS